jgi:micrococcal nuclease
MQAYVMAAILFANFETVEVRRVIDGDTFTVSMPQLPTVFGQDLGVRISGIDTAELGSKGCAGADALEAKDRLSFLLTPTVELTECLRDKYFRIVCSVRNQFGEDVGKTLLQAKLARVYDGGTKKQWVCRKLK